MKNYIFITCEGYTFQPFSVADLPDIENHQVVGFSSGENKQAAFKNLINENRYLLDTTFDELICLELGNNEQEYFCLSEYKKQLNF